MVKIAKFKVLPDYKLELVFDDGVCGVVDLSELVGEGVFSCWWDRHFNREPTVSIEGEVAQILPW